MPIIKAALMLCMNFTVESARKEETMPKLTNKCAICGNPILKSMTICANCASDKEARQREIDSQMEVYNVRLQSALLWEKRRYEIAKDIFTRCLSHEDGDVRKFCNREPEKTATLCVRQADALINALKNERL